MSEHQPATIRSCCPRCGSWLNTNRHYPRDGANPAANRYYCPPCDEEWWLEVDAAR